MLFFFCFILKILYEFFYYYCELEKHVEVHEIQDALLVSFFYETNYYCLDQ